MNEEPPKLCQNCRRDIPSTNFEMHVIHCYRNLRLCPKCDEPVPRMELNNHESEFHSDVKCPECHCKLERSQLSDHQVSKCPKRIQPCQYCDLELKAEEISSHEDYCGSRTECCDECGKLVMLKFQQMHLTSDHKLIKPDEHPSSESDDDNYLIDVESDYSRLMSRNRQLSRSSSQHQLGYRGRERNRRFDEDLDEHFQNMELNRIRSTSTAKMNDVPGTNTSHCPTATLRRENAYIPCEFCEAPVLACDLTEHQTGCRPDLTSFATEQAQERSSRMEQNAMNEYSDTRDEIEILDMDNYDDNVIIPCEFCREPFRWNDVNRHERTCGGYYGQESYGRVNDR